MRVKLYALLIGVLVLAFLFGMPAAAIPSCPPGEEWHPAVLGTCEMCPSTIEQVPYWDAEGYASLGQCKGDLTSDCQLDNCWWLPQPWKNVCKNNCQMWADTTCSGTVPATVYTCDEVGYVPCGENMQQEIITPAGCYPIPGYCDDNSDCAVGEICIDNQCVSDPCYGIECDPWQTCEQGVCTPPNECESDGDCSEGQECQEGQCVDISCPAIPCETGYECIDNRCVLIDPCADVQCDSGYVCEQGECVPDGTCPVVPCPPGYVCDNGECDPIEGYCDEQYPCPEGYHCIENQCEQDICGEDFFCRPGYECVDNVCTKRSRGEGVVCYLDPMFSTLDTSCDALGTGNTIPLNSVDGEPLFVRVEHNGGFSCEFAEHQGEVEYSYLPDCSSVDYYQSDCNVLRQCGGNFLTFTSTGSRDFRIKCAPNMITDDRGFRITVENHFVDYYGETGRNLDLRFIREPDMQACRWWLHGIQMYPL